jgi:hypothetical protein
MMFRRLQKQLQDTELGTGSGTTGTRTYSGATTMQIQQHIATSLSAQALVTIASSCHILII